MTATDFTSNLSFVITCEHGGNRIPSRYRDFFQHHEALLGTHRGYDFGALRLAQEMSEALSSPLLACTISRLLIDLNRSVGHPRLFSEATRTAPIEIRKEIHQRYYQPYRMKAETQIMQAIAGGKRVIHVSCHSFTPQLNGRIRQADIGLLYDPARLLEAEFCRRWQSALKRGAPAFRVRMNYPYAGTSDGFTTYLRQRFPADRYLGLELEVNQKHVLHGARHWQWLRHAIIASFRNVAAPERQPLSP